MTTYTTPLAQAQANLYATADELSRALQRWPQEGFPSDMLKRMNAALWAVKSEMDAEYERQRTPAPSDAARTQAIEHAARRVLSVFEVARSPWSGAPSRAIEPSGATEALDALLVAVESPAPPPPPMETAAVEELASALVDSITYYEERNDANPKRARSLWNDVQQRCIALSAALTRLRSTTTGTKEEGQ